jgi:hypothetical protein
MLRKLMPLLVVAATAGLTAAAIEFLPRTLYFPVVDFFAPSGVQTTFLQPGRTKEQDCEHMLGEATTSLRAVCSACKVVQRCVRGLPAAQRRALSHEPIPQPSARAANAPLTAVFAATDPNLAVSACRQAEQMSASHPAESRLRCFEAGVPR